MICLIEHAGDKSYDFVKSIRLAGMVCPVISCHDDGYLPDGIESPFAYFTQDNEQIGYPKYFNQVKIPTFWEIRGDNGSGTVESHNEKKANIFFRNPTHERYVRAVEWFDATQVIRQAQLYNKKGRHFSTIVYDSQQQAVQRVYYNQQNEIVIMEHYPTGSIRLKYNGQWQTFHNKAQFVAFYIAEKGYNTQQIIYNNLSTPFFVGYDYLQHHPQTKPDILFWQEPIGEEVPGNMMALLCHSNRQTRVAVDNQETYTRLQQLLPENLKSKVVLSGYIYEYARLNHLSKEILILTNSDQIAQLEYLVKSLSQVQFHIGAITEMSAQLMQMSQYANVSLYPNISIDKVKELYQSCDIYLDINYGNEILDAVRTAFNHNMFIASFEDTCHNTAYVASAYRYEHNRVDELILLIEKALQTPQIMESLLFTQKQHAGEVTVQSYRDLFEVTHE